MFFVVGCLVLFLCVVSASLPVKRLLQVIPVSHFLLSHISRVDRPCPVLARQCRKKMRKVVGYDFHHMRKKYGVPGMWGTVRPRWRLLQQHLEATGPGWYSVAEREERLFTNRSNQPGDDMKDEVRTDDDWHASRIWSTTRDRFLRLRQPGPPLKFPDVRKESFRASMTRSGKKSMLYRYSFLEVNKMCQLAE